MNQWIRLVLVILIVGGIAVAVIAEMMVTILAPTLQWQRERGEDRAAYAQIAPLHDRAAIDGALTGWKATTAPQPAASYCATLAPQGTGAAAAPCGATDRAEIYEHPHPSHAGPLQPLRILVIYDTHNRVVTTTTLD